MARILGKDEIARQLRDTGFFLTPMRRSEIVDQLWEASVHGRNERGMARQRARYFAEAIATLRKEYLPLVIGDLQAQVKDFLLQCFRWMEQELQVGLTAEEARGLMHLAELPSSWFRRQGVSSGLCQGSLFEWLLGDSNSQAAHRLAETLVG